MATIVKHVEGHMDIRIDVGILCGGCGTGNTKEPEPRSCRCGRMMEPYTFDFSKWIPGYVVIRCDCGATLDCTKYTNSCKCGRAYNFAGAELAPLEFWGEETGETWRDCLLRK